MAGMTNALEKEIVDGLTGVTQYTTPATTYLALFTADPTDAGLVTNEVSGLNYERLSTAGLFSTSTDGSSTTTAQIDFPEAGVGGWGDIGYIGLMKSGVEGTSDMILWGELTFIVTVNASDTFSILTGRLTIVLN